MMVFGIIMLGTWWVLSMISNRNSQAEDRLERIGRPKSLAEIEIPQARGARRHRFQESDGDGHGHQHLQAAIRNGKKFVERSSWPMPASAATRPSAVYQGLRFASLLSFLVIGWPSSA